MTFRGRIEAGFESWGRIVVRHPWLAIFACVALSAVLVYRLPDLRVDNSDEGFLREDDPHRIAYDRFKEQFDREDRILVVLRPPEIFDLGFLEKLRTIHREIEREVPYVAEVTSLVNARNTRGEGDELVVEDLLEDWPESASDLAALRERVFANPLYVDVLISASGEYTVLSVEPFTYSTLGPERDVLAGFDEPDTPGAAGSDGVEGPRYLTDRESYALVDALQQVVERHRAPDLEIHLVGGPTFDYRMTQGLQRDVSVFMSLSILIEIVVLFLVFRRASAVILPVLVVVGAMLSTMGFMVWLDIPFSITLNMLPAFLLVVGVCDSIHILTLVYRRLAAGSPREEAIPYALGHSGLAVAMTSLTTAAGLLSFAASELAPIGYLGILAPVGVMVAMAYSLVLLPALLAVSPLAVVPRRKGWSSRDLVDRFLARVGDLATRHPGRVVVAAAVLVVVAVPGVARLRFSHDGMRWFPKDDPLRVALELVNREFGGASSLELLVRTGRENGLHEPETLRQIERLMDYSETLRVDGRPVEKAISIVNVVKETHQALNENRSEFYALPDDRQLIAQELLLFENSGTDDLEDVTNTRFETARVTVRTPWVDAMLYPDFLAKAEPEFRAILGDADLEVTGGVVLFTRVFQAVIYSMARSYVFALAVITPMMVFLIGSLKRGLVAMIPNLIPVYLVLALMGWTDIPLDASTLLIGGVIIGLAVDDTIHFMHKFNRYYEQSGDPRRAVHDTLTTTGSALLFTSVVLSLGFAVLLFADMRNTFWFGLLALTATLVAFVADIVLAPALMVLVTRRREAAAAVGAERVEVGS